MTYSIDFDRKQQVLRTQFEGHVTNEDLKEFYQVLAEHSARLHPRGGLIDFSAVTSYEVSPNTIRALAAFPPAMPDPRAPSVVVAPAPSIFGLARMFQFEGERTRPSFHAVRTLREAYAILGTDQLRCEPIQPEADPS